MHLARIDPFRELENLSSRLNRMINQPLSGRFGDEAPAFGDWAPAMDIEETDAEYLVRADLPAIRKDDVKIGISDGILTVEGERKQEKEEHGKKFHRIERSYGKFIRRLALPSDVDPQKVSAKFADGELQVHLPKSASSKPRSIEVSVT
jgi:HSP20 family protein